MAPKRSAGRGKAGEAAGDEADVQGWKSSKCSNSHLLGLVESHLLQPRNVIHWKHSDGESFPHEEGNKFVVFLPHVLVGGDIVGGAGLQFRQGEKPKYIPYELSDKVIDWKEM